MLATATQTILQSKKINWAEFQKKYLSREDNFKYEWVNGQVEKSTRSMDKTQLYILRNLTKYFRSLNYQGILAAESDNFFNQNHRRPDIVFYTDEQIDLARHEENIVVPQFVIEVISKRDQMNLVHNKMQDYRKAGVQVVWHIFPLLEEIHVYLGDTMTICKGEKICSASPVLPDFQIKASDVFI